MSYTISLAKLRDRVTTLPEELLQEPELGVVRVTRDGKPVLAIMPWELFAVMLETLQGGGARAGALGMAGAGSGVDNGDVAAQAR